MQLETFIPAQTGGYGGGRLVSPGQESEAMYQMRTSIICSHISNDQQ